MVTSRMHMTRGMVRRKQNMVRFRTEFSGSVLLWFRVGSFHEFHVFIVCVSFIEVIVLQTVELTFRIHATCFIGDPRCEELFLD